MHALVSLSGPAEESCDARERQQRHTPWSCSRELATAGASNDRRQASPLLARLEQRIAPVSPACYPTPVCDGAGAASTRPGHQAAVGSGRLRRPARARLPRARATPHTPARLGELGPTTTGRGQVHLPCTPAHESEPAGSSGSRTQRAKCAGRSEIPSDHRSVAHERGRTKIRLCPEWGAPAMRALGIKE